MTPHWVLNQGSTDFLAGGIVHDALHQSQSDADIDSNKFVNNERQASAFAAKVACKIGLDSRVVDLYSDDAAYGHLSNGKLPGSRLPKTKKP